ncbi:MAG: pantoate--beta-alanine ligase [Phenylobacterium zucineum]|nr:MAG: pantoate--beta-alanine ligase [Phenylobacterium zucineum]
MRVISTIAEVRAARMAMPMLGLVPTMGFLHPGHLSLVKRAKSECGLVAASIFVNPTQFGPNEDFGRYPRARERDLALLEAEDCDLVFTPDVTEIYPAGFDARIDIGGVTEGLEGAVRPGHFTGVATVVAKLFNIFQPTRAYFGQKDAQQCAVIRKLVRDLDMPLEVVVCETVREVDGLAMSSRNAYLSPAERAKATILIRALRAAAASGDRDAEALRRLMRDTIHTEPLAQLDYVSVADPDTLEELNHLGEGGALLSLAVRVSGTRLIDNLIIP